MSFFKSIIRFLGSIPNIDQNDSILLALIDDSKLNAALMTPGAGRSAVLRVFWVTSCQRPALQIYMGRGLSIELLFAIYSKNNCCK